MKTARFSFNDFAFAEAVKAKRSGANLSITEAAADADVARPALFRAEAGQVLGAGNFLALCRWLGVDPLTFLVDGKASRETGETLVIRHSEIRS